MKQELNQEIEIIQPNGRYDYLVDGNGVVYLVDNQDKVVRLANLTKRMLSKRKMAYLYSKANVVQYFKGHGYDILDLKISEVDGYSIAESFSFEEHVYSKVQVQCDICRKFRISEDNKLDQYRHVTSHFVDKYNLEVDPLSVFKRVD